MKLKGMANSLSNELDNPEIVMANMAYEVATAYGNKTLAEDPYWLQLGRHFYNCSLYQYGTNGLAIKAVDGMQMRDEFGNITIYGTTTVTFNNRTVFESKHYVGKDKQIQREIETYIPGLWEDMIKILYVDSPKMKAEAQRMIDTRPHQLSLLKDIQEATSYWTSSPTYYKGLMLGEIIENGQIQGADYSKAVEYFAKYNGELVFRGIVNCTPVKIVKYVPGEWEQLLQEALNSLKTEYNSRQEEKDLDSYNSFLRMRSTNNHN